MLMLANGYLCVHYGILFTLCIFEIFYKFFLKDYYHNLEVYDGSSRGGGK